MQVRFSIGILAGILLASVIVFGSSYASSPPSAGSAQGLSASGQSRTTAVTATASSTTSQATVASVQASLANVTSTSSSAGAGTNSALVTNSLNYLSTSAVPRASSLAAILDRPGEAPLLLVPVIGALLLGLTLYRLSAHKD